jgi:hypothetical protein
MDSYQIQGLIIIIATLIYFIKNVFFRKGANLENCFGGSVLCLFLMLMGTAKLLLHV